MIQEATLFSSMDKASHKIGEISQHHPFLNLSWVSFKLLQKKQTSAEETSGMEVETALLDFSLSAQKEGHP